MSALGDMIRGYEKQIDEQEKKLEHINQIASSCFKIHNAKSMQDAVLEILALTSK